MFRHYIISLLKPFPLGVLNCKSVNSLKGVSPNTNPQPPMTLVDVVRLLKIFIGLVFYHPIDVSVGRFVLLKYFNSCCVGIM